jgi:hypothetical protein
MKKIYLLLLTMIISTSTLANSKSENTLQENIKKFLYQLINKNVNLECKKMLMIIPL